MKLTLTAVLLLTFLGVYCGHVLHRRRQRDKHSITCTYFTLDCVLLTLKVSYRHPSLIAGTFSSHGSTKNTLFFKINEWFFSNIQACKTKYCHINVLNFSFKMLLNENFR